MKGRQFNTPIPMCVYVHACVHAYVRVYVCVCMCGERKKANVELSEFLPKKCF